MTTLTYFAGRGRAEPVRMLLAYCGESWECKYVSTREQMVSLIEKGDLMWNQLPLLEIDGHKLVQTQAMIHYIALKHKLVGDSIAENVQADMINFGVLDLRNLLVGYAFTPNPEERKAELMADVIPKWLRMTEKAFGSGPFVLGQKVCYADVMIFETLNFIHDMSESEEFLTNFPHLKALYHHFSSEPRMAAYIQNKQPGMPTPEYVADVKTALAR